MYNDGGKFDDEHAYGAVWLHLATGHQMYLDKAKQHYNQCCSKNQGADQASRVLHWGDVSAAVNLLMFEATNDQQYGKYAYINHQPMHVYTLLVDHISRSQSSTHLLSFCPSTSSLSPSLLSST